MNDVLSTENKERIRSEEIFREEVRKQLSNRSNLAEKIWKTFNSPLVLLIISGIFLNLVSVGYQKWTEGQHKNQNTKIEIQSLDLEIGQRVENFFIGVNGASTNQNYAVAITKLREPSRYFLQYKENSFVSLVVMLSAIVPPEELDELDRVRNVGIEFSRLSESITKNGEAQNAISPLDKSNIIKKAEQLKIRNWFGTEGTD